MKKILLCLFTNSQKKRDNSKQIIPEILTIDLAHVYFFINFKREKLYFVVIIEAELR